MVWCVMFGDVTEDIREMEEELFYMRPFGPFQQHSDAVRFARKEMEKELLSRRLEVEDEELTIEEVDDTWSINLGGGNLHIAVLTEMRNPKELD